MQHRRRWMGLVLMMVGLAVLAVIGQGGLAVTTFARSIGPTPTPSYEDVCQQVLTRAVALTERNCDATGRNEACYGSNLVQVELQEGVDPANVRFERSGDILPVRNLARIQTQGLDPETGDWGLALIKLQANLPNTNPGQNVTCILYGNTSLSPAAGQTNAFYLSTELGELTCNELPSSSLVVRAPHRVEVAFTLNDVEIKLASTLVFSAVDSALRLQVLEGHASVTAAEATQVLVAGQELVVPLDAVTGQAVGAPSEPVMFDHEPAMDALGGLLDTMSGEALEGPATLEGQIELIDAEGGWVTVDGRRIKVPAQRLAGLEVGQTFRFNGYGHGFIAFELPPGLSVREGELLPTQIVAQVRSALGLDVPAAQRRNLRAGTPEAAGQGNSNQGRGNQGRGQGSGNPGNQGNPGGDNPGGGNPGKGQGN